MICCDSKALHELDWKVNAKITFDILFYLSSSVLGRKWEPGALKNVEMSQNTVSWLDISWQEYNCYNAMWILDYFAGLSSEFDGKEK